jgi:hypothetical protein
MGGACFSAVARAAEAALRCRDNLDLGDFGAAALAYRDFRQALLDVRAAVESPPGACGNFMVATYAAELLDEEARLSARLRAGGLFGSVRP